MKKIILILFLVCFFTCNETKKIDNSQEIRQNENTIKQVSITIYGGDMGVSDSYTFTKDSIFHDFHLSADTTQNTKRIFVNKVTKWERMIDVIDLSKFDKGINGESNQEFDGIDMTISITIENGKEYIKTNSKQNTNWNHIYTEFKKQINEQ